MERTLYLPFSYPFSLLFQRLISESCLTKTKCTGTKTNEPLIARSTSSNYHQTTWKTYHIAFMRYLSGKMKEFKRLASINCNNALPVIELKMSNCEDIKPFEANNEQLDASSTDNAKHGHCFAQSLIVKERDIEYQVFSVLIYFLSSYVYRKWPRKCEEVLCSLWFMLVRNLHHSLCSCTIKKRDIKHISTYIFIVKFVVENW